ncbi:MAG: aminotransferase class I/II-fold pyridoxal phosphate-dependent enzyme [Gammaproteobacteria bacterium]|nr:aminotransferase class I/II-fold pyridoxal phosphate-dependent enzyme [Gammaproteobacteria bacterium]
MVTIQERPHAELRILATELRRDLELQQANRLSLDLTRGKPAPDQLDLSRDLDTAVDTYIGEDGVDARNYGTLRGVIEARKLGAQLMGVDPERVFTIGNSSLFLMYMVAATAYNQGLWGDDRRWTNRKKIKVLTPVPGYDRHFTICESLNVEMVNVAMTEFGPDMERVLELTASDASIKGIWCVPKYSNPTGCIYSDATVAAMAELPNSAAADDFVVFWDNAYAMHDFEFPAARLANLYSHAERMGTEDHVALFASTSKITYASGGLGFFAGSERVLATLERALSIMLIGPDKISQLRHARFLNGRVEQHMAQHAKLLRPKFELVNDVLERELGGLGIATWTKPRGGYFVSMDVLPGTANRIVALAQATGLTLTPAGATFPYGRDPQDQNIRIAPTFATLADLKVAMHVLVQCVKLVCIEQEIAAT